MILSAGTLLNNRYEIIEKLGSGGMAVAYCGRDKILDRYVTIKVLREEFSLDDEFKEKFKVEARSAASLSDPNIVSVYDVGEDNSINYIVMEYIHGDTLKKAIKEKAPFDTKSIVNISLQIASALYNAHKHNVIHRDIKPQNILINSDGVIKVTDFGIAKATTGTTIETTANTMGSVHYFSPEQARGGYVDEKSDIYSLGITMFEMATGKVPFDGENTVAIALKHLSDDIPDMREFNPNLSKDIELIIKKATMKRLSDRYLNISDMISDLMNVTENDENEDNIKISQYDDNSEIEFVSSKNQDKKIETPFQKIKISNDNDDFEPEYVEQETENLVRKDKKSINEYEDEYDKKQERKVIIAAIVTAFLIIGTISFVGLRFLGASSPNNIVKVPMFVGDSIEYAQKQADELGIQLVQQEEEYSNYEKGVVFYQSYEKGESIKKGSEIFVKVSKGFLEYEMPDIKNKEEKDAIKILSNKIGIEPDIEYRFSDTVETGFVISQSPEKGTKVNKDSEIKLVISKGEEFKKVNVPNVVGETEASAKKILSSNGLVLGTVTKTESTKVESGKVITQTLVAGDVVAKNSVVDIVVSTGAPEKPDEDYKPNEPPKSDDTINNENVNNENANNDNINNSEEQNNNNQNNVDSNVTPKVSTINFPIYLKDGLEYEDVVHVRLTKTNEDGTISVIKNSTQPITSFPTEIPVTGSGKSTVECHINGSLLWSENVDFSQN